MSRAEQIADAKKIIEECSAWIALQEKLIVEGNEFTIPFDIARRDSWRDVRTEATKLLAKLEAA